MDTEDIEKYLTEEEILLLISWIDYYTEILTVNENNYKLYLSECN